MRFMSIWRPGKNLKPQTPELMAEMGRFVSEEMQSGRLVLTGGWDPTSPCTTLKVSPGGEVTVTDGPFAETKELVAGFAIMEVKSKEEAIALGKRFLALVGEGNSELRRLDGAMPE